MEFPYNATTSSHNFTGGASTHTRDLGNSLYIYEIEGIQTVAGTAFEVRCGTTILYKNFTSLRQEIVAPFRCSSPLSFQKFGSGDVFYYVIYSTSSPQYDESITGSTTLNITGVDNGTFTLFAGLLLFMLALFFTRDRFKVDRYE